MKTINYISIFSLISLITIGQNTIEKTLEPFQKIITSGVVSVNYQASENHKIEIAGTESDIQQIEYYVKQNTLFIGSKGSLKNALTILVSNPQLTDVSSSGASSFKSVDVINAQHFTINALGASNILLNINSPNVTAVSGGAANLSLKGKVGVLSITAAGASNIKAYDLIADTCTIDASGASTSKVNVLNKININATSASTVKFKGEPKEISAEGGNASRIMKIGGGDSYTNLNPQDTSKSRTTFKYKNKQIIIIDRDDFKDSLWRHNYSDLTRKHWQGLWLGFAGYTNPQQGFGMENPYKYMELDYGRSFSFQWNLGQKNLNIYKKYIQLSTGLGIQFNNLSFENKTRLNADSSFTWGNIDSTNFYSYKKNRFKQSYLVVPLLLNFNTSKSLKHNFHFTCGVIGKYLLNSKTKQILVRHSDEYLIRRKDSYNLNPFQFDAYASVGYRNITIYAQYALTNMFKNNKGPQLLPFSAGIRLLSFD